MAREVILAEQTVNFNYVDIIGLHISSDELPDIQFEVGAEYTVVWNGVEHKFTAFEGSEPMVTPPNYIAIGNKEMLFSGNKIGEPSFVVCCFDDSGGAHIYTIDDGETHSIEIYEEVAGANIVLKNLFSENVYNGITTVQLHKVEGGTQVFTLGEAVSKTVDLDFTAGNMNVPIEDGELITSLTINKPDNLVPENIPAGMFIAGVGPGAQKVELDELFNKTITKAICPETISVYQGAFSDCKQLSIASFPKCITINSTAFYACSNLTDIYFPECESIGSYAFAGYGMAYSSNGAYGAGISVADFPKCSIIHSNAFYNCWKLSSINFPTCKTIGVSAFGCTNTNYNGDAPKFSIASFPVATSISSYAFAYLPNLRSALFPEATYVGSRAFMECKSLKTAHFPKVTTIYNNAFYACGAMSDVEFPSLQTVYSYGFWNINGWKSLTPSMFPALTTIYSSAFQYNYYLSYVHLPAVKAVYNAAFSGCTRIETMSLPNCSLLSTSALVSCSSLMSLYLLSTSFVTIANSSVFNSTPIKLSSYTGSFGSIYVRASMLSSYQTRANWSTISARLVGLTDEEIAALDAAE